jgi:hypothetical protein
VNIGGSTDVLVKNLCEVIVFRKGRTLRESCGNSAEPVFPVCRGKYFRRPGRSPLPHVIMTPYRHDDAY